MENKLSELRSYLKKELKLRQKINSSYSNRAFARDLGISPTSLGAFLKGERNLNMLNINRVFNYINKKSIIRCSWCDKPKEETKFVISGPRRQFICNHCIDRCVEILQSQEPSPSA